MEKNLFPGQKLSREQLKKIMGGDVADTAANCKSCSADNDCGAGHVCDSSSSCPYINKVCVLKSRRTA